MALHCKLHFVGKGSLDRARVYLIAWQWIWHLGLTSACAEQRAINSSDTTCEQSSRCNLHQLTLNKRTHLAADTLVARSRLLHSGQSVRLKAKVGQCCVVAVQLGLLRTQMYATAHRYYD
jgi:hypothetical protein